MWALLALSCLQAGYIATGAINVARTDADLRAHITADHKLWHGTYDSTGRLIVEGQRQWNRDAATNQKDLANTVLEWCMWLEDVMRDNGLKQPATPKKPTEPKFNTPDGSQ